MQLDDSHFRCVLFWDLAAGNDGSTDYSFPGSYLEVVSVGAVDSAKSKASFSQTNDRVDLVAPGVDVLSTVPQNMGR